MSANSPRPQARSADPSAFTVTRWTLVLTAAQKVTPEAQAALASLCERYWYPLYSYARRVGHNADDAQDLVQGFFAQLLEKNYLKDANPAKGRFRTFLLMAFNRYRAKEWQRATRQKRGGGVSCVSIDSEETESRYLTELANSASPESVYDREWALALLGRVLDRLEQEYADGGRKQTFTELSVYLTGEKQQPSYAEVGCKLGSSDASVRVMVHRLRKHYKTLLRNEIAETVANPDEVEEELRYLFFVIAGIHSRV